MLERDLMVDLEKVDLRSDRNDKDARCMGRANRRRWRKAGVSAISLGVGDLVGRSKRMRVECLE